MYGIHTGNTDKTISKVVSKAANTPTNNAVCRRIAWFLFLVVAIIVAVILSFVYMEVQVEYHTSTELLLRRNVTLYEDFQEHSAIVNLQLDDNSTRLSQHMTELAVIERNLIVCSGTKEAKHKKCLDAYRDDNNKALEECTFETTSASTNVCVQQQANVYSAQLAKCKHVFIQEKDDCTEDAHKERNIRKPHIQFLQAIVDAFNKELAKLASDLQSESEDILRKYSALARKTIRDRMCSWLYSWVYSFVASRYTSDNTVY